MLILILLGMHFHAVVVFTLGYDFLFKSILGHCEPEVDKLSVLMTLRGAREGNSATSLFANLTRRV